MFHTVIIEKRCLSLSVVSSRSGTSDCSISHCFTVNVGFEPTLTASGSREPDASCYISRSSRLAGKPPNTAHLHRTAFGAHLSRRVAPGVQVSTMRAPRPRRFPRGPAWRPQTGPFALPASPISSTKQIEGVIGQLKMPLHNNIAIRIIWIYNVGYIPL